MRHTLLGIFLLSARKQKRGSGLGIKKDTEPEREFKNKIKIRSQAGWDGIFEMALMQATKLVLPHRSTPLSFVFLGWLPSLTIFLRLSFELDLSKENGDKETRGKSQTIVESLQDWVEMSKASFYKAKKYEKGSRFLIVVLFSDIARLMTAPWSRYSAVDQLVACLAAPRLVAGNV